LAALVIIGVSIERGGEGHADTGAVESTERTEGEHAESSEGTHHEEPVHADAAVHKEETVLGMPIESPAALVGLAVVSLGLAVLVWRRPTRLVTGGVVVFTVAAGVLDVVEISRQVTADRAGLVVLAGLIVLLRVVTVAGAAMLWRTAGMRVTTVR
jgi:hypothetical protein